MTSLLDALIQVESAGIPGRRGPMTKYGQALGLGQTLPGTAREMAQKLGLPWRPDLLTSPTPEGAEYQRQVSQAYLSEGQERTGNTRDALRYYHGGPNRRQWGPKTDAYADKVMGLAGGDTQPMPPQMPPMYGQPQIPDSVRASFTPQQPQDEALTNPTSLADILSGLPSMDDAQVQKPKAFGEGGKGWVIAGIIADALAKGFGGQGQFAPTLRAKQEDDRAERLWREKIAAERADRLRPKLEQVGDTIGMVDPSTGEFKPTYQAAPKAPSPTNAARMLIERGFTPGTPEFQREMGRYMNRPLMIGGQPFAYEDETGDMGGGRSVVRTGVDGSGRRVVQYDDGTVDYAD